jgi:hypothetical protein
VIGGQRYSITKLNSRGAIRPLRSDGSHDGQSGGWTALTVTEDAQSESWKTILGTQGTYIKTDIVTA